MSSTTPLNNSNNPAVVEYDSHQNSALPPLTALLNQEDQQDNLYNGFPNKQTETIYNKSIFALMFMLSRIVADDFKNL